MTRRPRDGAPWGDGFDEPDEEVPDPETRGDGGPETDAPGQPVEPENSELHPSSESAMGWPSGPDDEPPLPDGWENKADFPGYEELIRLRKQKNRLRDLEPPDLPGLVVLDPGPIKGGGMGVIWRVRDPDLNRLLAVKVLRWSFMEPDRSGRVAGADRFLTEAQITARLAHPFIVPVHARGWLPDGRPYFSMKLIEMGKALDVLFADQPDTERRCMDFLQQVFVPICEAVAFAHRKGVIHRDLKPANVMVGDHGEVQVMDWGLAKDLGALVGLEGEKRGVGDTPEQKEDHIDSRDRTCSGSILGTASYMSPEAARGCVDQVNRRSDVFGLGAILCEILTGLPPYVGNESEVSRQAREGHLEPAMTRLRGCRADPELIKLAESCLAPNAADRPADGGEVVRALGEYITGVQQRLEKERDALTRRETEIVEQHRRRRVIAWAGSCVLLALILGTASATWFAIKAYEGRQRSKESFSFLVDEVLAQADPESEPNRDLTVREAMERAIENLDRKFRKYPEAAARLRAALGKIYFNLGEYQRSRDLFNEAYAIASRDLGENDPASMTALDQLGKAYLALNRPEDAERVLSKAYKLQCSVLGPEHKDTVHSYAKLADVYWNTGRRELALAVERRVLEIRRRRWGDQYRFTLVSLNNLGLKLLEMDRPTDALPLFEEAGRMAQRTLPHDHPDNLTYTNNRALALMDLGKWGEARALLEECLVTGL